MSILFAGGQQTGATGRQPPPIPLKTCLVVRYSTTSHNHIAPQRNQLVATWFLPRGRKGGHIALGTKPLEGAEKSQKCRKYFLPYSTFAPERF